MQARKRKAPTKWAAAATAEEEKEMDTKLAKLTKLAKKMQKLAAAAAKEDPD